MSLFALAATVAAFAQTIDVMLVARFVQGMGGASAVVLSRAIVRDIASGKSAAKLMSLMTMIFTVAPVVAPSIGALMVAQWGWRAPFIAATSSKRIRRIRKDTRCDNCREALQNSSATGRAFSACY